MPLPLIGPTLDQLRREVAAINPSRVSPLFSPHVSPWGAQEGSLRLGVPALDDALQGGLAFGALHELAPASELQLGAAFGFGLAIAALAAAGGREVLCIQTDSAALAAGTPYALGLDRLVLATD